MAAGTSPILPLERFTRSTCPRSITSRSRRCSPVWRGFDGENGVGQKRSDLVHDRRDGLHAHPDRATRKLHSPEPLHLRMHGVCDGTLPILGLDEQPRDIGDAYYKADLGSRSACRRKCSVRDTHASENIFLSASIRPAAASERRSGGTFANGLIPKGCDGSGTSR